MSDAARSLSWAVRFAQLAERAPDPELAQGRRRLELLWREIAGLAECLDCRGDPTVRERIYELIDEIARHRHAFG